MRAVTVLVLALAVAACGGREFRAEKPCPEPLARFPVAPAECGASSFSCRSECSPTCGLVEVCQWRTERCPDQTLEYVAEGSSCR